MPKHKDIVSDVNLLEYGKLTSELMMFQDRSPDPAVLHPLLDICLEGVHNRFDKNHCTVEIAGDMEGLGLEKEILCQEV